MVSFDFSVSPTQRRHKLFKGSPRPDCLMMLSTATIFKPYAYSKMLFLSCMASFLAILLPTSVTANDAPVDRAPSAGCGTQHTFPGQTQVFSIQSDGRTRSYRLHLPSNYKSNEARPLLIVYHGSGNNPANFENESRFANETLNPNMITVFPAGVNVRSHGP